MNLSEDELFKNKDKIFEADSRFKNWGAAKDINYFHDQLSPLGLKKNIPPEIIIEFDVARNIFLYSHFSYRLTNAAAQIALGVLEKFLKFHIVSILNVKLENDTLSPLINYYLENEIITSEFFAYSVHFNKDELIEAKKDKEKLKFYFKHLIKKKRNALTHDSHKADIPWNNLDILRDVSAIINFLYKDII